MKRNIIILLALIILFAMPVLAEAPEQENAPMASEDELFLGEMSQLSEQELKNIEGQVYTDDSLDPQNTFNPINGEGTYIDENGNIKEFKIKIKERINIEKLKNILWSITNLGGSTGGVVHMIVKFSTSGATITIGSAVIFIATTYNGLVALSSCLAALAGVDSQTIQNINNLMIINLAINGIITLANFINQNYPNISIEYN